MTIVWWNWGHPTPSTKMTTILVCWNSNRHSFIHSFKWLVVIIHTHSGYGCLFLCLCLSLIAFYLFLFVQIKYKIRVARQMVYKYNGITQTINIKRLHSTHRRGFFLFFLIFICWCVECAKALYWNRYLRLSDDSPHHHHHSRHKKKTQHTTHKRLKKNEKLGWIRKYTLSYFNGPWQLLPAERGKVGRKRPSLFLFFSCTQQIEINQTIKRKSLWAAAAANFLSNIIRRVSRWSRQNVADCHQRFFCMTASKARDCWAGKEKKINSPHTEQILQGNAAAVVNYRDETKKRREIKTC